MSVNNEQVLKIGDGSGWSFLNGPAWVDGSDGELLPPDKGGKEYLCNLKAARATNYVEVNYAAHAASMGAETETVISTSELEAAFLRAKQSKKTYVIVIKTHGYEWLKGTSFWESPTLEVYSNEENKKAYEEQTKGKEKQRKGV